MQGETANTQLVSKPPPNPKRVAAGRLNRAKRKALTIEGRQRLRQAAIRNKPWRHSTGPRTAKGKAQSVRNGKKRQLGPASIRELRAEVKEVLALATEMAKTSKAILTKKNAPP